MLSTDVQVREAQLLVIDVFKSLRSDLLSVYGNIEHTRKGDSSPVTVWDVKVEETLRAALEQAYPEIGFEGEETGEWGNRETYWLVDPIDGTSSFIRGLPFCTNMAALVDKGHVIAAVIYDFVNDVLYTALKDQGAFKNGEPIQVNTTRGPGNQVVYSLTRQAFGHLQEAMYELGIRLVLPMGAAGYDYALLAEGKIDGVIVVNTHTGLYDNAPGLLLAEEAGAVMLQYDNEVGVRRHEFIVGAPSVVERIEHSGLI